MWKNQSAKKLWITMLWKVKQMSIILLVDSVIAFSNNDWIEISSHKLQKDDFSIFVRTWLQTEWLRGHKGMVVFTILLSTNMWNIIKSFSPNLVFPLFAVFKVRIIFSLISHGLPSWKLSFKRLKIYILWKTFRWQHCCQN